MVNFKNMKDLEKALDKQCYYLVEKAAEKVKQKIEEFIKEYYSEFSPEQYKRTWTLLNSVVKTKPEKIKNGYKVRVYIEPFTKYNSFWGDDYWTVGDTMDMANAGYHGRYDGGYPKLWDAKIYPNIVSDDEILSNFASFMESKGIKLSIE